ncbi:MULTISPECIES: hypothetical protein [Clostridium]|uniref:Uncharacterized protein n=1 Tax=Clostridium frigoriphilum TaxID=443253 RepID=A0ABU7UW42_9CLOT|nr:hypothetical protein [Clostridium sp. DSM 17811]MBU3101933.1 hypothetical protein [Clostridium sp. DSM 17811]
MNKQKFVKIVKKLICGFILVIYLTTGGIVLWSKIVRATSVINSKYAITNMYEMSEGELNLFVTKDLYYVTSRAVEDKRLLRLKLQSLEYEDFVM